MGQLNYTTAQINALLNKINNEMQMIIGSTDPTTSTTGAIGQQYFNSTTNKLFVCINVTGEYTWSQVGLE